MALGPRLDLRQTQSLVMTPQLQQAIKLLAASNLEIETFIAEAMEANPLLDTAAPAPDEPERGEIAGPAGEDATADQLMLAGGCEGDAPLDLSSVDRDWDTGDGEARSARDAEWGAASASGGDYDELPDWEQLHAAELTLTEHLEAQIGDFVSHYNHRRYHESLDNLTPADVYCGRGPRILERREAIKQRTIELILVINWLWW